MSVYVCSDIHGLYDLYKAMLKKINLSDDDHLYILGDMVDRGPDGIRILQDAAARPNVTCLIGNHEFMMWNYLKRTTVFQGGIWLHPSNGGKETLSRFKELTPDDRKKILSFLGDLYLQVEIELEGRKFLLSHSSFLPDYGTVKWRDSGINKRQVSEVVWNSPWRHMEYADPESYQADGRFHIIGHVPVLALDANYWPEKRTPSMPHFYYDPEHRIANIDLGCAIIPRVRANRDAYDGIFLKAAALCVLNLTEFARGEDDPAVYIGIDDGCPEDE